VDANDVLVDEWLLSQFAGCWFFTPWQRVLLKQPGVPGADW